MIGICILATALLSCSLAAIIQSPPTTSPQVTQAATVTINPKLRRALLQALSNFDGEDSTESDEETTTLNSVEDIDGVTNNPSFIKVHSFAINGDKSDENEIIKTIIISRPRTTLTPPKTTSSKSDEVQLNFGKTPDPISSVPINTQNIQQARSVETRISANNEKKEEKQAKKKASEKSATKPITPVTTTTLPPPVTNEDGENIEKVAKDDVKIFQAPLLAAFTVQQDASGQPNKVISLFKNPQHQQQQQLDARNKIINMEFRPSQPEVQVTASTSIPITTISAQTTNSQLISVYEQKQRLLEEQIRILQARQREHEEIIRRHQLEQQQSRLRNEEDQRLRQQQIQQAQIQQNQQQQIQQAQIQQAQIQQNQQQQIQQAQNQQNQQIQQAQIQQAQNQQQQIQQNQQAQQTQIQQQQLRLQPPPPPASQALVAPPSPTVNVQFVPSIPIGHTVGISVEQQLPFKGPVEFNPDKPDLQKSFSQRQQQFQFRQFQNQQLFNQGFAQQQPIIQQQVISQLPQNLELPVRQPQEFNTFSQLPTSLELPQKPFQTFNSAPLTILPSLTEIVPQVDTRNRVFRNDALQTGNFGVNSHNVQFQPQQVVSLGSNFDSQLQNLLLQSGISPRSTEDFRIISKVLSLNHGIPNNFLFNNNNSGRFF